MHAITWLEKRTGKMKAHISNRHKESLVTYSIAFFLVCSTMLFSGCSTVERKPPINVSNIQAAKIDQLDSIRFIPSTSEGINAYLNELRIITPKRANSPHPSNYLSLSGGGDNGAFGAGLLSGWTANGSRPEFDQVVGISTGALVAPFAFLGSEYDNQLREVFTSIGPRDIYNNRSLVSALFGDSLADNSPLFFLIEKTIDRKMLDHIAAEYQSNGRLLLIGTTNIDTGQLVIWNMGKIASERSEQASNLFHRIMLASAAVPGVFPPQLFDASIDNQQFHELHVDGGLSVQIYLYPAAVSKKAIESGLLKTRERQAFIIRNAPIAVDQAKTSVNSLDVLNRSYKKIIQAQGVGNLYQIYQIANRDNVGFNLAFIGDDFKMDHPAEFDKAYMEALFDYGYQKAMNGYPWSKNPPGLENSTQEDIALQSLTNKHINSK